MPTPKQMEKLAGDAVRKQASASGGTAGAGAADMPPEYWQAVLSAPRADARQAGIPIQQRRLSEIPRHMLRVSCLRCDRIVEIQMIDAVRLYGEHAIWKDVGMRLLDNTCRERTGRYGEDGCWPNFELP